MLNLPFPIVERITDHLILLDNDAKQLLDCDNVQVRSFILKKKHRLQAKITDLRQIDRYRGLNLTKVSVSGLVIGDEFLLKLKTIFPNAKWLSFEFCDFMTQDLALPSSLTSLSLAYCTGISDALDIKQVPKLRCFSLTAILITNQVLDQIPKTSIRHLSLKKLLYINSSIITLLASLSLLKTLDLSGIEWITNSHISQLVSLLPNLKKLILNDCPQLTSKSLERLVITGPQVEHNCKLYDDSEEAVRDYLNLLLGNSLQ
jgi:hypothetical protein